MFLQCKYIYSVPNFKLSEAKTSENLNAICLEILTSLSIMYHIIPCMRLKLIYIEFTVCLIWHIVVLLVPSRLVLLYDYNFHLLGMYHLVQLFSLWRNKFESCDLRIRILFKTNMPWREVVKWIVSMLVVVVILLYHCLITGYCWLLAWDCHESYCPFDQPVYQISLLL